MEKSIKTKDILALVAFAFSKSFGVKFGVDEFTKLPKSWLLPTKSEHYELGSVAWKKAVENVNLEQIYADFDTLQTYFELDTFGYLDNKRVEEFYLKLKFKQPFSQLKSSHAANVFALLAVIFKEDKDERSHAVLGKFLSDYCLPSATLLAKTLIKSANSDYYVAIGHFIMDYFSFIKVNLGLRANIE